MASRDLRVHIIGDDESLRRAYRRSTDDTKKFERQMSQMFRTANTGGGAFKSLGKSLAFATGGFLGAASVTEVLRDSITEAQEVATVQKQLATQFRATGMNLQEYQDQIDETVNHLSLLAGFEDDELMNAFVNTFRGTRNVEVGLKVITIAADVARARHIELTQASIALTKAFAGQTSALRRIGINVPATLHGMEALTFVQKRFAGQAEAGTTEQDRFAAAIKNTEQIIGTALLPAFNQILAAMTKWLGKQENQKSIQDKTNAALKVGKVALEGAKLAWDAFMFGLGGTVKQASADTAALVMNLQKLRGEVEKMPQLTPPGLGGPLGTPSLAAGSVMPGLQGPLLAGPKRRASLAFQASILNEQLAKAELTASTRDDRAVLVRMQNLVKRRIAVTKDLKERTALYQSLGSVQSQIQAIDDRIAADKQDAADKEKAAKLKQLEAEKRRLENHREMIRRLRQAWQDQLQKLREAADQVRNQFGALPFQANPAGILGVPSMTAGGFAADYAKQTRTFVAFYNDLGRISKRGAPRGLVEQLRGLGVDAAGLVHSLATGRSGALRSLIKSFQERERVVQQISHADIHARYVTIHMAGTGAGATQAAQRRGRQAGNRVNRGPVP